MLENLHIGEFGPEGDFYNTLFDKNIKFFAKDKSVTDLYIEKCIDYLNSLSDAVIDSLCKASLRYYTDFLTEIGETPKVFQNNRDILRLIQPGTLIIDVPNDIEEPVVHLELSCEWEEEHGLEWIVCNDTVLYVGPFQDENPWRDFTDQVSWNYSEKIENKHNPNLMLIGLFELSLTKLRKFHPSMFRLFGSKKGDPEIKEKYTKRLQLLNEHILYGDSQPAVVLSVNPMIVAVYSDDMDCVMLLRFKSSIAKQYDLKDGDRLLSVNTYGDPVHHDIIQGPASNHEFNSFWPVIVDFLSEDKARINDIKSRIADERWTSTYELGKKQLQEDFIRYRFGEPFHAAIPLKGPVKNWLKRLDRTERERK